LRVDRERPIPVSYRTVAMHQTSRTLSESESKAMLAAAGVPFAPEREVLDPEAAAAAAADLTFPVVAKLCGDGIAHKTERGLVRLRLGDATAVRDAAGELFAAAASEDGEVSVLIAPMIAGQRELIAGVSVDPQFGPTVMVGVGGVLAEAVADVAIRLVPITPTDAAEMLDDLDAQVLLGPFRGEPPVDRDAMVDLLVVLSRVAETTPGLRSIDLNPLIVSEGRPIAVDALVELDLEGA
jgi:acetate---CoA ligase (ADP-forming) subunit beta